jgi:membrane fusion protein (multidrug efflux system)
VNRTFLVEASLQNDDIEYRANMIAVLRIKDYTNPSCIAIPQDFIQSSRTEGNFAFVVVTEGAKKVARKKYLKTGITYNGLTEITGGLSEGDLLITAGYKDLYDGQAIDFK